MTARTRVLVRQADAALEIGRDHLRKLETLQDAIDAEDAGRWFVRFKDGVPWFEAFEVEA